MRTSRRLLVPVLLVLAIGAGILVYRSRGTPAPAATPAAPARPLVAAIRAEPRSFNRLVAADRSTGLLALLLHARLVQLNQATQEIEPALASSWTLGPDGRTYTLQLRQGVTFSDGAPFTADDVVFTFEALYDPKAEGPLVSSVLVDGKPIAVQKTGDHTVVLTFPAPYGPGLRILNNLPILPAHKLRPALAKGEFAKAWTTATPPAELAGLGPFILQAYVPGDRLELARNPRYGARGPDVHPGVERLTLRIIPTQDAERLALEAGEIDLLNSDIRPEDLKAVRALAASGKAKLYELGPAVDQDTFWFNLGPDTRKPARPQPWQSRSVRQAVAHAVDRTAFINTVYLGAGVAADGPVPPGNRTWYARGMTAQYPHDLAKARALLTGAGFKDTNGDGTFEGPDGKPFAIELLTQRGLRERGAAVIAADLKAAGLTVNVVSMDVPALVDRLTKGTYDAAYFAISASDTDPSTNLDYWLSSGSFHIWHPSQKTPATGWEAEIDRLMRELTSKTDPKERQQLFGRVQAVMTQELPVIAFAAPTLFTATSARVAGAEPSAIYPYLLWRADTLRLAPAP
jgi:peptide/nickel transport system substrate-binding protein